MSTVEIPFNNGVVIIDHYIFSLQMSQFVSLNFKLRKVFLSIINSIKQKVHLPKTRRNLVVVVEELLYKRKIYVQ